MRYGKRERERDAGWGWGYAYFILKCRFLELLLAFCLVLVLETRQYHFFIATVDSLEHIFNNLMSVFFQITNKS